jgi:hypothetical protein
MTVMNQLLRGVAFAPSDGEMAVFLPGLLLFAHHDYLKNKAVFTPELAESWLITNSLNLNLFYLPIIFFGST